MSKKEVAIIHHNDLNKMNITTLNKREIDIFFSIVSQLKDKQDNSIIFEWDDLKKLGDFSNKSNAEFQNVLINLSRKLASLHFFFEDEKTAEIVNIFDSFKIHKTDYLLEVRFKKEMLYLLNDLTNSYSRYDLKQLVSYQSKYSQHIYRYLKQFKATGVWRVSVEDFKTYIGAPASYQYYKLNEKILKPAVEELSDAFYNLKVVGIKGKGKNSRKINMLEFTFDKDNKAKTRVNYRDVINDYIEIDGVKYKRVDNNTGINNNPLLEQGMDADFHKKMWDFIETD